MSLFLQIPINQSGYAFLLFFAGLISVVNGISLIFDERKLNKYLSSTLLVNSGVMLIFDSLHKIGYPKFGYVKVSTLVVQLCVSFLSLFLVWGHNYERDKKLKERKSVDTKKQDFPDFR